VGRAHYIIFTGFTEGFFETNGLLAYDILTYPYLLEDSLVGIAKIGQQTERGNVESAAEEFMRARHFSAEFPKIKQRYKNRLTELRALGERIAVFGAGHLAVKFLNLYDLGDLVDYVVDDSPHKQGMLMPGSRLPIFSSKLLDEGKVDVCLMALSPEREGGLLASKRSYLNKGGKFFPYLP